MVGRTIPTAGHQLNWVEPQTLNRFTPRLESLKTQVLLANYPPNRSHRVRKWLAVPETAGSTAGSTERQTENLGFPSRPRNPAPPVVASALRSVGETRFGAATMSCGWASC